MKYLNLTLLFTLLTSAVFASLDKAQVVVRVQAQNGNIDEATLYFDQGINPVYVYQEDAQKVFSGVSGVPAIFSLTSDSVDVSINGFGPVSASPVISLGFDVDVDGQYDISTPLIDNLAPTSIIRLEDRQLGLFVDLRMTKYTAQINASDPATGRFFLHVSKPSKVTSTAAGCSNDDGVVTVDQDNSVSWTSVTLYDSFNNAVGTYSNATGQFNFNNLAEGDYFLIYQYGPYSATEQYHITGRYVVTTIEASKTEVEVGEVIDFTSATTHANNHVWDFGDGTIITGVANPTINYYAPGIYEVTLISQNDYGCSDNDKVTITVTEATISGIKQTESTDANIFAFGSSISVNLNKLSHGNALLNVYNLIGQQVYSAPINSKNEVISMGGQPNGYYIVSVKNAGDTITQKIYLNK